MNTPEINDDRLTLPERADDIMDAPWEQLEQYYHTLLAVDLVAELLESWMDDWTRLNSLISEAYARLHVLSSLDTNDAGAEQRYLAFIENIYLKSLPFEHKLKEKLLDSGLTPENFQRPMENIRAEIEIYTEKNLPLHAESEKLSARYSKISGSQTVMLNGEEKTIPQLRPLLKQPDRELRKKIWQLASARQLQDRESLNALWVDFLKVRREMAANSGKADYTQFRWLELQRFDYSPEDCHAFHDAIEAAVVPAAQRVYERRRRELGVDTLRPWDVEAEPVGREPLKPFTDVAELEDKAHAIFKQVDPELGEQFAVMRSEGLLDLANRKGKAPGGFCTYYPVQRRPFIFMNAVGIEDDVKTLLHEAGHSFHDFARPRWFQQWQYGTEFAEVASMSMELLSTPFIGKDEGGFYSGDEVARARIEHLENNILFWPYMAVVDGFQLWAYRNPDEAADPSRCDDTWRRLWDRFMVGIDYSGYDDVKETGWHRKLHIFQYPLYYVEYGLAQLGAVQVWANSLSDYGKAVADYRKALALGAQPLPVLFGTAGARFGFDAEILGKAVSLMEGVIDDLLSVTG